MSFKIKVADIIADQLVNNNTVKNMDDPTNQAAFLASNHSAIKAAVQAGIEMEILRINSSKLQDANTDRVILQD